MQQQSLSSFSELHKRKLETQIKNYVSKLNAPTEIKESMLYSLEAGGKRIRPMLLFASLAAFGEDTLKGMWTAAAIEMVHTYSLIHDDLPSMDNDDLRRGKPTNHKVFGEAFAILAGDALLTYSFQSIAETPDEFASADTKLSLIMELSKASGAEGMVGGQAADIKGEGKQLGIEDLEYIHVHKTGKLLECSVVSGAILANASQETIQTLSAFAYHLGLAFQIRDDILDLEGTEELIGKPVGSDESKNKSTYPSLLTMNGAKEALANHIRSAKEKLKETGLQTDLLEEITDLIANRDH
ncbi:farnesyl-diphosphate synthase [Sporosarcina globispora]|uniref:Farnesyl diphosphate synthase n=1 Tax=Sporosarcina globispora TaxID=1459 RepID=A0A0M0GB87_SPOGL|nr:farnesyl diphosphate synthase [Sporosarcina globispora]KON87104.1 farnesyl-diphosphate synthase [Sporosarcina globispora]